jgi:hypothetical protein
MSPVSTCVPGEGRRVKQHLRDKETTVQEEIDETNIR